MSIYGQAKGTPLEAVAKNIMQGEANGTMMYYALARLAREQNLPAVAKEFERLGDEEAFHAGFYATLAGKYPQDFWNLVRNLQKVEAKGEGMLEAVADKFRAAGLTEAAEEIKVFAKQEAGHGEALQKILTQYAPPASSTAGAGKKIFVCPVCGYEYVGDIADAPEDYVCPICGQPKSAFKEKV